MVMSTRNSDARQAFDWVRFWVRFACGAVAGVPVSFSFWVQMCRPLNAQNLGSRIPRKITELLHLGNGIDAAGAGLLVMLLFAILLGVVVGLWRAAK